MVARTSFSLLVIFSFIALTIGGCRLTRPPAQAKPPAPTSQLTLEATDPSVEIEALTFQTGRNDYTVTVDDTRREFIIYVPINYDASQPTPVVFMFHGTNGTGAAVYENTNWAKKADEITAIVVFPSSWRYFLITENGDATKWNDVGLERLTGPDADLKDDVKFTRVMIDLVRATFNVDEKRIFATGFSNGGGFVSTRLMIEMPDIFAAFSTSGSGTKLSEPGFAADMPPSVSRSYYSILGTQDDVISAGQGVPLPFPFDAEEIADHEMFGAMLTNTASYLNLNPTQYEVLRPREDYIVFLYDQSLTGDDNEYIFQMVKGMFHVYPDGETIPRGLDAVEVFWDFFSRHPMK